MTSHSPVVIRELGLAPLTIVRRARHGPELKRAGEHPDLQGTARRFPEAFLAKSVLVCEGATEVGFMRGIDQWCFDHGKRSMHAAGACLVDGNGGGIQMLSRAEAFRTLGYRSALLRDDDKRPPEDKEASFELAGGRVFKWRDGRKIEVEIFESIPPDAVKPILDIALEDRDEQSIDSQLRSASGNQVTLATVREGVEIGTLSDASRSALGEASAKGNGWFKSVSTMERVARDVIAPRAAALDKDFRDAINAVRTWCLDGR
jgi:putative ATP-dependent endonuclease of the OLD family